MARNVTVTAQDGVSTMIMSKLLEQALGRIMRECLDAMKQKNDGMNEEQVFWELLVPAVWDETTRSLLRRCAEDAGMRLVEVGSQRMATMKDLVHNEQTRISLEEDEKALVLDTNGSMCDVSVIERACDSDHHQLNIQHIADREDDAFDVDQQFINVLKELLPQSILGLFYFHLFVHRRSSKTSKIPNLKFVFLNAQYLMFIDFADKI